MSEKYSTFALAQAPIVLPFLTGDILIAVRAGVPYQVPPTAFQAAAISYVYAQPLTGNTLTAIAGQGAFVIDPAGAIAALTVVLPPGAVDGQVFELSTTQTITALTVNPAAGDTVVGGAVGVLAANGGASWRYGP